MEAVALVTFVAAAEEGSEGVGAVAEHVARPVLALVLVRHGAALAAPAVVTVTLRVQARTIDTTVAGSVQAVI